MTIGGSLDFALATLRHLPNAFILLDEKDRVAFVNIKGEELLDVRLEEVRGRGARELLNLKDAHNIVHGETSATWINGGTLEFVVSQYPVGEDTMWRHLALRYPSGKPSNPSTVRRPQPHSEASFEQVKTANNQLHQSEPEHDDFWNDRRLVNILEKLPTLVAAVSKDGSHVYQNRMAFDTMGSISWSQTGLISWLEKQWGSTHGDGTPFAIEDYPIYKTAVLAQNVDDYETCFEDKSYLFGGAPQYDDQGNHLGGIVFAHDITDMKREGQEKERMALAQSETNFRAITDAMDQLVWTCSPTGEVQYLNRRWYEYTGAGRDASLGLGWFSFVHPDERESARAAWLMLMPDQDSLINSHRMRSFDGTYRTFLARARCIRDEQGNRVKWLGTSTDITELTEALEEAKSTREHLLSITSAANVHYWVIQEKNDELQMTSLLLSEESECQGLYGYLDRAVLLHRDVQHVFPETLVSKSRKILRGQQNREVDEILVKGEYWRTQLSPLRSGDGSTIVGVVGTAMNITQEKIKDQALQRADTARDVAVQSSTFKSEFLARMSHEIRTPIGGILGMAQLLSETALDATQRNFLNGVLRSGDGLLVIINDILDFSKIEVGKLDIESLPFDLKLVAEDVIAGSRYGPHINSGVELKLNYHVPVDIVLLGDRNRVMQILLNLTSNALKFTKTGCVTINISTDHAQIYENGNSGSVVIVFEVIDTGVGIPQHVLSKLFTPFTQADSTTCRKFGGTGLGLTIARQLATLMSGTLGLASTGKDGEGATAKCIIPFTLCPKSSLRRTSTVNEKVDGKGAEVLLVEDNKINQTIAVNMLKKMNFKTRVANHGQEALDILHAGSDGSYMPSLVLMDCQMPVLDGYETTRLLRNDFISAIRRLPVIAMTASAIRGDKEKCLEAGMNDYLSKPVKQEQLGQIVAKWMSEKAMDIAHLSITPPTTTEISKKRPRQSSATRMPSTEA